jgi:hypothetical protein
MSGPNELLDKTLLENALSWFQPEFRHRLVSPIESHFPNYPLPRDIQAVLNSTGAILTDIREWSGTPIVAAQIREKLSRGDPNRLPLFKQIILLYRRHRAAFTESKTEKTFHLELTGTLEQEVKALDALVNDEWFEKIEILRLPRLKDFLPIQLIEAAAVSQIPLSPRQHDEKFHILQAPNLFLPDLIVEPDCPLTDRELRDRASQAKKFAKDHGRNCIATYKGPRFLQQELEVVRPQTT